MPKSPGHVQECADSEFAELKIEEKPNYWFARKGEINSRPVAFLDESPPVALVREIERTLASRRGLRQSRRQRLK